MSATKTELKEEIPADVLKKVKPAKWEDTPLVLNKRNFHWVTEKICGIVEQKTPTWWWWCFITAMCIASFTGLGLVYLVSTGVGVWGNNNPVNWGWAIVNFVFWIGIGHAGTLISAILCLLKQKWRTSINRASEAMTVFAVMCAGIFLCFMWVGYGLRGGYFHFPMLTLYGRSLEAHWNGMYLRFPLTLLFPYYFGTWE